MQDNQKTKTSAATDTVIEITHVEQHGKAAAEVGIKPNHQHNFKYFHLSLPAQHHLLPSTLSTSLFPICL